MGVLTRVEKDMIIRNKQGEQLDYTLHEASERKSEGLVVLGHGVTGNKDRELIVNVAEGLCAKGWDVLRFSFAGNGESEGNFRDATITKEVEDLHSVLDQVKGTRKVAYIGHSMGGAVGALASAKDDRINVLVSLAGMVQTKKFCELEFGDVTPDEGNMWDEPDCPLSSAYVNDLTQIDTVMPAIRDLRTPWLLLHGTADDVVFPEDSELLYAQLKGEKKHTVIEGADHSFNDHWDRVVSEIDAWIKKYLR